jgi:hypothetical protein
MSEKPKRPPLTHTLRFVCGGCSWEIKGDSNNNYYEVNRWLGQSGFEIVHLDRSWKLLCPKCRTAYYAVDAINRALNQDLEDENYHEKHHAKN